MPSPRLKRLSQTDQHIPPRCARFNVHTSDDGFVFLHARDDGSRDDQNDIDTILRSKGGEERNAG